MNSVANPTTPVVDSYTSPTVDTNQTTPAVRDDSLKRTFVMLSAILIPLLLSVIFTGLFKLLGNYEIVELVPAKTEFANISFPEKGKAVGNHFTAKGEITKLPENKIAYLMVKREGLYWPKKYLGKTNASWSKEITESKKKGSKLHVVILAMDITGKQQIDQWYANAKKTGKYPGIKEIPNTKEIAVVGVKQK